jgi:hypothetical protein
MKRTLNAEKGEFFYIRHDDPNVTIKVIRNKDHPFYSEHVERPVDPEMVASLKMHGQVEIAVGVKQPGYPDGKQVVVLTKGRGRWAAMQVAWAELMAEGSGNLLPPFKVQVKRFTSEREAFEASIIADEHRTQDSPLAKAKKLQAYLDMVPDDAGMRERARIIFNIKSDVALDDMLKLLELDPSVQAKVDDGTLSPAAALKLGATTVASNADEKGATTVAVPSALLERGMADFDLLASEVVLLVQLCALRSVAESEHLDPSVGQLAARMAMSRQGVKKVLDGLEQKGWIKRSRGRGRRGANVYDVAPMFEKLGLGTDSQRVTLFSG